MQRHSWASLKDVPISIWRSLPGTCSRQRSEQSLCEQHSRLYSTGRPDVSPSIQDPDKTKARQQKDVRAHDRLAQRDFFLDVLNTSATRRDAKQYLARFKSPKEKQVVTSSQVVVNPRRDESRLDKTGVNLGGLYAPTKAIANSPIFVQELRQDKLLEQIQNELHVALVSIRAPHLLDGSTLNGIALTLSQLVRLDMQIVVTFNCSELYSRESSMASYRRILQQQAGRLIEAIEQHNNTGARYVEAALTLSDHGAVPPSEKLGAEVQVAMPNLLLEPLKRMSIPVIPSIAYNRTSQAVIIKAEDVLLSLTKAFSGVEHERQSVVPSMATTLDRIIMIDPLGGLPSSQREDKAHVFINLEQEYDDIARDLDAANDLSDAAKHIHIENMMTLRSCLALLSPASSALVVSPEEAASSSQPTSRDDETGGIATRRPKNPLIHNLLTNKPIISSSLPVARFSTPRSKITSPSTPNRSTLLKRGMPVTIIPDPRKRPWCPPSSSDTTISLVDNPDINFPRLLRLIEDSFRRPLDVQHYLSRIQNRLAGIIIAGEYEGGAILTWEMPPQDTPSQDSSAGSEDVARLVPYLDKFAVAQRSQGSSGVADIVFQAMVRNAFPDGVCWRSRKTNPVNKWYFERARGSWDLPGGEWTMFWTTEGVERDRARWEDYVGVCMGVKPSWADGARE